MKIVDFTRHHGCGLASCLAALALSACGAAPAEPSTLSRTDLHAQAQPVHALTQPLVIAHRGYSAIAPENTTTAVDLGAAVGAEFVEIDVQMAADGGLVVMHDTTLSRTTNAPFAYPARAPWNVADFSLDEMRGLDAGTWYGYSQDPLNFRYAGEPVPDLRIILETLRGRAGLLLEVKSPDRYPGIEAAIAAELEDAGWVRNGQPLQPLIVQSFNWDSMATYARLHPGVPIGLLGNAPADEATWARVMPYSDWINPSHSTLTPDLVAEIHSRGLRTSPYTVDDSERMQELLEMGVDGIITNQPVRLQWLRDSQLAPTGEFELANPEVTELSGLARSPSFPGVFWGHNDSGDSPRVFAFDRRGRDLGSLSVFPAAALDWEDMGSYTRDGQGYLLLADVGDNDAIRPFVNLYIAAEPTGAPPFTGTLLVQSALTVVYPDGPRDCEGVAVDAEEGAIYLLSKRDPLPRLYRIPLDSLPGLPVAAEFIGEIASLPLPESGQREPAGTITNVSPTGLAFSGDGRYAMIVTLEHTYRYQRLPGQSWLDALNTAPKVIKVPAYKQIESGDFVGNGPALLIGSEGEPAPIYATAH